LDSEKLASGTSASRAASIHATAIVDSGARIGQGTRIWHWVHISAGAVVGEGCSFGQNVYIGNVQIGNNVKIQNNVSVYDGVVLENDVFCGPSMVFTNVINPRSHVVRRHEYRQTLVKRGATIGANATIVCGHTIGQYAMIGAGTVVTKDIADFALVVGNPARQLGWVCRCGVRLTGSGAEVQCPACYSAYTIMNNQCNLLTKA
jgi:UDP-2-acetamido-3-amino-2,3-dideoxy-glucuronate N-acetyltransferase